MSDAKGVDCSALVVQDGRDVQVHALGGAEDAAKRRDRLIRVAGEAVETFTAGFATPLQSVLLSWSQLLTGLE